jgi:hypothetical protein
MSEEENTPADSKIKAVAQASDPSVAKPEEKTVENPVPAVTAPPLREHHPSSYLSLIIMLVCIVTAAICLIVYFTTQGKPGSQVIGNGGDGRPTAGTLVSGQEYLIYLRSVEIQPLNAQGKSWDTGNNAPDVFYRVIWQNNQIYESETMQDSLIADWIPLGLSLKDSLLKGQVSVDQAIKIPKVKFDANKSTADEVIFTVLDKDLVSGNDHIEDLSLLLSKLHVGDNVFDFNLQPGHGLIKAVVRVIDNSLSTDEKIQALMRGQ